MTLTYIASPLTAILLQEYCTVYEMTIILSSNTTVPYKYFTVVTNTNIARGNDKDMEW